MSRSIPASVGVSVPPRLKWVPRILNSIRGSASELIVFFSIRRLYEFDLVTESQWSEFQEWLDKPRRPTKIRSKKRTTFFLYMPKNLPWVRSALSPESLKRFGGRTSFVLETLMNEYPEKITKKELADWNKKRFPND